MSSPNPEIPPEAFSSVPYDSRSAINEIQLNWWLNAALAVSSGMLLSAAYIFPSLHVLCWVGFVPLLYALRHASVRQSYWIGALAGLVLNIGVTYWVTEFVQSLKGYSTPKAFGTAGLLWVYSAQTVALTAVLLVWLRQTLRVPTLLLFPLIVVIVFAAYPTVFTMRWAETQTHFLTAIQAISITGVYGLDFIVALMNAAIYSWIVREPAGKYRAVVLATSAAVVVAWFAYGIYTASTWKTEIASWEKLRVGIVQPNETPSIGIPPPPRGYSRSYPPEMPVTRGLALAGAELVIWPENRFKGFFEYDYVRRAYRDELAPLKTPLLFHDMERVYTNGERDEYNSVAFVDEDGVLAGTYRKVKLIPFGEYIPEIPGLPAVRVWLREFLRFHELAAGTEPAVFRTERFAVVPLVCYEVAFPLYAAEALDRDPKGKIFVTMSNDGWFGKTHQPYMHGNASVLRAVENRVPLIHVLNNGPSLVIRPDGRYVFRGDFGVAGGYVVDMPYSRQQGGSFYSRYPYWFISLLMGLFAFVVLRAATAELTARRAAKRPEGQLPCPGK